MITFFRKLLWLHRRREKDAELREELEFHLAEETERQIAAGLPREAAHIAARRELGNVDLIQDDTRSTWGWPFLDQLGQDLRYGVRAMKSSRLFTLLAMLTLALGIGANTAIFSFLDAILIRTLPAADPQSLVVFKWHTKTQRDTVMHGMSTGASSDTYDDPQTGVTGGIFPYPAFELFQKQNHDLVFSTVFAFESAFADSLNVSIKGEPGLEPGVFVSGEYFSGLGVSPEAGRLILPDDDRTGAPAVAVISYSLSEARFGGPANAIGQSVLVDNSPFTVVGVTPQKFFGVDPRYNPSIYLPFRTNLLLGAANPFGLRPKDYLAQNFYWVQIMARLRHGVSRQQAEAALVEPFHQWVLATASNDQERAYLPQLFVQSAATGLDSLRRDYSRSLYLLLAIVALILLLACANVANLLLARAAFRGREIALRLSIGAGRRRILRQLLTENLLLASASGVLGILFASGGIRFLALLMANGRNDFPVRAELNWHVLVAALALSLLTGVVFGLAPALQVTRVDVLPSLKESRGTGATTRRDFRRFTLSNALVAGQIAVSMLLLVAAGLFLRTLSNLQGIHLGFNRENVLLFRLNALKVGHKDAELFEFYETLRRQFSEIPGVEAATVSEGSIVNGETGLPLTVNGAPVDSKARIWAAGARFFETMQIPILAGRDFDERDRPSTPAVVVINERFAKTYFSDRNPLGEHVQLLQAGTGDAQIIARDMEIVGVSRDASYGSLTKNIPPVAYILFDQAYPRWDRAEFALRTAGSPLSYADVVRQVVRRADPRIPISELQTQVAEIDQTISEQIAFAKLCSAFAVLALTIACVGLYGSVSYGVARRTSEIGLRMALGAQRSDVIRLVLREVSLLAGVGLVVGAAVVLATSRFVESFLYGIRRNDPVSFLVAGLVLVVAAFVGAYAPARRASRIDPMIALRHE